MITVQGPQVRNKCSWMGVHSQTWTPQRMRVFSTIHFPWFCSISSVGPVGFPFTYLQKGRICKVKYLLTDRVDCPWPRLSPLSQKYSYLLQENRSMATSRFCLAYTCSPKGAPSFIPTACFLELWRDGTCDELYVQHVQPFFPYRIQYFSQNVLFSSSTPSQYCIYPSPPHTQIPCF